MTRPQIERILEALAPIIGGAPPVALDAMPQASVVAFSPLTAWKAIEEAEMASGDDLILEAIEDARTYDRRTGHAHIAVILRGLYRHDAVLDSIEAALAALRGST